MAQLLVMVYFLGSNMGNFCNVMSYGVYEAKAQHTFRSLPRNDARILICRTAFSFLEPALFYIILNDILKVSTHKDNMAILTVENPCARRSKDVLTRSCLDLEKP